MDNDRVLDLLEAADWNDIAKKLTYYAIFCFDQYSWRSDLPKGNSPDDIALKAIEKVWDGSREWDHDKYPDLLKHLKWIVKSDVEHLNTSLEHRTTGRHPVIINEDGNRIELEETNHDYPHSLNKIVPTPEDELIKKQKQTHESILLTKLNDAVKGDEDLELLLMCFDYGIDKADAISVETGWDIKKVYNLKRKLLRKAVKIGKENLSMKGEL